MKKAIVFMANGFEEIEALTVVDILRRADIHVDMCSINDSLDVTGAHGVKLKADIKIQGIDIYSYDAVIAPGGLPGATNLRDNNTVIDIFKYFYEKPNKVIAAICAAPIILNKAEIAPQIMGTCYPGCEGDVGYKEYVKQTVVVDKNVLTSRGPSTAFSFAIKLVELIEGEEKANTISKETLFNFS
ncbi:DJ-1 family glyoxalase III [Peptostreptococcus canis]|uniref:DJ-1 family protein n=1 Tax=Peptostreptococcus canis TaxID=1159213 RepID=A0ABR6TIN5_9FIRM|nr:DJ-1 family glyoxalase III [Peptostreptococcus canis]MBC2575279.1 DJ-1 family protein [Peptostreptococcus canis]MBP1997538.1 4-methyl-5(b-hydroxyethyl)-thiazole monophosphate biosynthesis [Peptostreptococcus canis]